METYLNIFTIIVFHVGSVYLSYEDIKNRSVTLWIFLLTMIFGLATCYPFTPSFDIAIPIIIFSFLILGIKHVKKTAVIAVADFFYIIMLLLLVQDLWWILFIFIGLLSCCFYYINHQKNNQPFIAILYGAYLATLLLWPYQI